MHEMSIALAVVDQVEDAARSHGASRVRTVRLRVGELAGVVPDALAFSFQLACAGTLVEGADLVTETVPGLARCAPCGDEWAVGMPPRLTCPVCDRATTELVSGRELRIAAVEWHDDPADPRVREPISEEG
ncbi:hydrogenase maturation nickel metallochaperone HypA [Streptomyces sp. WMMC940]|uniref:hydrogenase maturation nickel metallochaperone HypA n=1 Tax=Streptomyces sp. WMMC940 TaxID=3015153 RepID=UPI0022B67696|nr:hydrogenase maturation nickel metallochaperone HypA [Streptomyces sp. WMMC940]MCZ7461896.1 hydrogenase maturation nickel metallochaperone HypA [Streptomyces sp. WMMC940]